MSWVEKNRKINNRWRGGDLNLDLLDHRTNTKVKDYLSLTFQNVLIPLINKPTRITKANTALIDNILTNDFLNSGSSTGIVKSGISDHSPIFLIASAQYHENTKNKLENEKKTRNLDSILWRF